MEKEKKMSSVTESLRDSVQRYRCAAELGLDSAQYALGVSYEYGIGVDIDKAQALQWYREAAAQGHPSAKMKVETWEIPAIDREMPEAPPAPEQEPAEREKTPSPAAESPETLYARGVQAEQAAEGREEGLREAWKYYMAAAEQEHAGAQFRLGEMYLDAVGVAQDDAEAVKWLQKATVHNNAAAQNALAWCYMAGRGVAADSKLAVQLYLNAARQGYAKAQLNAGLCYADGDGVEKDDEAAVWWYRAAAKQGNAQAQYQLGMCYFSGTGLAKDEDEALRWLRKAAEQGEPQATRMLKLLVG